MGGSLTECQPPIAVARGVESQERSRLTHVLDRRAQLVAVDDYNQFGSCQAIWRRDDGYVAASDPRRAGGLGCSRRAGGGCPRVNAYFPESSSIDDDFGKGVVVLRWRTIAALVGERPELIEMRRRTLEEFDRELDHRQPGPPNAPDPVAEARIYQRHTVARKRAKEISPVPLTDVADVTRSLALSSPRRRALPR
jgi:hypothetical protein